MAGWSRVNAADAWPITILDPFGMPRLLLRWVTWMDIISTRIWPLLLNWPLVVTLFSVTVPMPGSGKAVFGATWSGMDWPAILRLVNPDPAEEGVIADAVAETSADALT